ncbi:hypothetical protein [Halobacillus sp. B23F22_1]|uniref:hypothetical protein n=1 Tax=Halobacillus sp. B23F22_1 TaxID=3459514 RepID=UPI00373E0778
MIALRKNITFHNNEWTPSKVNIDNFEQKQANIKPFACFLLVKRKVERGGLGLTRVSKTMQWLSMPRNGIAYDAKTCPLQLDSKKSAGECSGAYA